MTTRIFTWYRDSVESDALNEQRAGIITPGRYNGFEKAKGNTSDMDIKVFHEAFTSKTRADGSVISEFASLVMPSGLVVQVEGDITVTLDASSSSDDRIDLFICELDYEEVTPATAPLFTIVKGTVANTPPPLPNPEKQIIIGYFTLLPNAAVGAMVTYQPAKIPLLGGIPYDKFGPILTPYLDIPGATSWNKGLIEIATDPEAETGVDTQRAVTPRHLGFLESRVTVPQATEAVAGKAMIATDLDVDGGANDDKMLTIHKLVAYRQASDTKNGLVELATNAETLTGADTQRAVTPAGLKHTLDNSSLGVFASYEIPGINAQAGTATTMEQTLTLPSPLVNYIVLASIYDPNTQGADQNVFSYYINVKTSNSFNINLYFEPALNDIQNATIQVIVLAL